MRTPFAETAMTVIALATATACDPGTEEVDEVEFPADPVPPGVSPLPEEREAELEPEMPPVHLQNDTLAPEDRRDPFPPAGRAEDDTVSRDDTVRHPDG
jgi:hypothetical protein